MLKSVSLIILLCSLSTSLVAQDCVLTASPTQRFKDHGAGTVIDEVNGRIWLRCSVGMAWNAGDCEGQSMSLAWNDAQTAIDELNAMKVAGRNDWRLPSIDELRSLDEPGCYEPAIELSVFPRTPSSGFWTSTDVAGVQLRAMIVHFLHGGAYIANREQLWHVRPVSGSERPINRWTRQ